MPEFHFHLRFHLPQHKSIIADDSTVEIPVGDDTATLRLSSHENAVRLESARRLVLAGGPYGSSDEAALAGTHARNALIRYSVQSRVAVDLGKNQATGGMSKYLKDRIAESTGVRVINDVHGLLVYDGAQPTKFVYVKSAAAVGGHPLDQFLELFQHAYAADFCPTDKQEVAFELFAASQFEPAARSRFLTLVMAVEALLEPLPRAKAVQAHVTSLINQTEESGLPENERRSLRSSLQWLFQDSISRTGRQLAKDLLSPATYGNRRADAFFSHCYDLRSQLVHNGKINDDTIKLDHLVSVLDKFVADLLNASIQPVVA